MAVRSMDAQRVVQLLTTYGETRFGDDYWPGSARSLIGREKGVELERRLDAILEGDATDFGSTIALLGEYGRAKFGGDWRPDDAASWESTDRHELASRLGSVAFTFERPALAA